MTTIPSPALRATLEETVKLLNDAAWEGRVNGALVQRWLAQFSGDSERQHDEKLHALFLLSHFLYFGHTEIRCLLKSLYRDMVRAPALHRIRRDHDDTLDRAVLAQQYDRHLRATRFLAVGNPSESAMHLLYYFRQENALPKDLFLAPHDIFTASVSAGSVGLAIRDSSIQRYVFLDDLCGSGTQAVQYSRRLLPALKSLAPSAEIWYLVLFASSNGLRAVRDRTVFDRVDTVFELDDTFRSLDENSRVFNASDLDLSRSDVRTTCEKYGMQLWPEHPLGYRDGQLLLAFSHNTPDNTLPIFWGGKIGNAWVSTFRRYDKVYGHE